MGVLAVGRVCACVGSGGTGAMPGGGGNPPSASSSSAAVAAAAGCCCSVVVTMAVDAQLLLW